MNYEDIQKGYAEEQHKEIHLSNSKLLLMFLGAALVCGAFFGFGYSVGKHGKAAPVAAVPAPDASSAKLGVTSKQHAAAAVPAPEPPAASVTVDAGNAAPSAAPAVAVEPAKSAKAEPAPVVKNVVVHEDTPAPAYASGAGGKSYVVQVAAVSHQGDADILVNALKRKGYQVSAVPGQDNLIHVQVGPFATQKDASAMSARLSSDGYSTIVK